MQRLALTILAVSLALPSLYAQQQQKEPTIPTLSTHSHQAHGTFTVEVKPLTPAPAEGLGRFSIDKQIHGDLEATTKGEMFSGGDFKQGAAGYVAIEVVTGTLDGRHGTFALQHSATMDADGPKMTVLIVPGSGTGELKGVIGTFTITIAESKHTYTLDYTLPSA